MLYSCASGGNKKKNKKKGGSNANNATTNNNSNNDGSVGSSSEAARPTLASTTPPRAAEISASGPLFAPVRTLITSATSSALPNDGTKGWLMSLTSAEVGHPAARAVPTRALARATASTVDFMKAPEPTLTSRTRPSRSSATMYESRN